MAHPPFESWKRRAPSNREEARAADLIQKLGEPETLSPQAMNRVGHRLRSPGRRLLPLFTDIRLAAASVAVLLLFVLTALATLRFFDRAADTTVASSRGADRTLALNETPPPPEEAAPADTRLEEPQLVRPGKGERRQVLAKDMGADDRPGAPGFAQPPRGWSPGSPASQASAAPMKKADSLAEPPAETEAKAEPPGLALDSRRRGPAADWVEAPRAAAPAATTDSAPRAGERASAQNIASAPMLALGAGGRPSAASDGALARGSPDACSSMLAAYSQTIASNEGEVEQALFGRGTCLLRLGRREAGNADLRAYLARFPNGRFVERVRALLPKAPAPARAP